VHIRLAIRRIGDVTPKNVQSKYYLPVKIYQNSFLLPGGGGYKACVYGVNGVPPKLFPCWISMNTLDILKSQQPKIIRATPNISLQEVGLEPERNSGLSWWMWLVLFLAVALIV
jgi:hypothetical protein